MSMNKTCPISNFGSVVTSPPMSELGKYQNLANCRSLLFPPNPTGFAEIVCDDFPVFHSTHYASARLRMTSVENARFKSVHTRQIEQNMFPGNHQNQSCMGVKACSKT